MTDLVFFAGPVVVTAAHKQINWRGRDVRVIPIVGEGSANFESLAESLRGADKRILPNLIAKYAPGVQPEQVALCAYSAGWGLLNRIADVPADRQAVTAMILSDAVFSGGNPNTGQGGVAKSGFSWFGADAIQGDRLMVATTAHTTSGEYLTGRQSFRLVWEKARQISECFCAPQEISPRSPVPAASGGWWQLGSNFFWGDYTKPNALPNQGNDLSHGQHNDLSAAVWQAYLAPWLAGERGTLMKLGLAVAGVWAGAQIANWLKKRRR